MRYCPILSSADYLVQYSAHAGLVSAGVLAKIVSALAGAGIAVAMYRVMKRASVGLALGSVVFRTVEAAFYLVGAMSLMTVLKLSQRFATAGIAERAVLQAVGDSFVGMRGYAAPLLGVCCLLRRIVPVQPLVLPVATRSPMAVRLRRRRDSLPSGRVCIVLVQRQRASPATSRWPSRSSCRSLCSQSG